MADWQQRLDDASRCIEYSEQAIPAEAKIRHLTDAVLQLVHVVQVLGEHSAAPREVEIP